MMKRRLSELGNGRTSKARGCDAGYRVDDPEGIVFSGNWAMENGAREAMSGSQAGINTARWQGPH